MLGLAITLSVGEKKPSDVFAVSINSNTHTHTAAELQQSHQLVYTQAMDRK